jgi:hypothetical protein
MDAAMVAATPEGSGHVRCRYDSDAYSWCIPPNQNGYGAFFGALMGAVVDAM